jgi:hypothetical protein
MGAIPEIDLARIRRFVDRRNEEIPPDARREIRIEMDVTPTSVTIFACRPPWRPEYGPDWTRQPVARLRYTKSRAEWSLYWTDRNSKFYLYDRIEPTPTVEHLLAEIEADPTCIFWG